MADKKNFILDGYRFETEAGYIKAKSEMKRLTNIKKTNDLRDEANLRRVYDVLVETEEFSTPIGLGFLREAQKSLIKNPDNKRTMKAIPVTTFSEPISEEGRKVSSDIDYRSLYEGLQYKLRNMKIILGFMFIIIAVIFSVTVFDRSLTPEKARETVLNEYASWKEELTSKERELREREKLIREKEEVLKMVPEKRDS